MRVMIPSRAVLFAASIVTAIAAGCISGAGGDVRSFESGLQTLLEVSSPSTTSISNAVTAISAGHELSCALFFTGAVSCWGWNSRFNSSTPSRWSLPPAVQVTAFSGQVCVRTLDKRVLCGKDQNGPFFDPAKETVLSLGSSGGIASAVSESGHIILWNASGGPSDLLVFEVDRVTHVAEASAHFCACHESGRVTCQGRNGLGQLGDGTTTAVSNPRDYAPERSSAFTSAIS